jgi:hypothetical protein
MLSFISVNVALTSLQHISQLVPLKLKSEQCKNLNMQHTENIDGQP